jgi:catechol 2,3-dioxygenase-like lactoylglutathione lyase family enzyme
VTTPSIRWLFHTTAMIADYDVACDRLALLAGLRVLEYSESEQPEIGRRGGMTWIGDNAIELGQPIVDTGGAARFVARSGGGMHSVAVQVEDVEATMAHIEACGVRVAARPMAEFCFSDPRDTHGVFFEWGAFELHVDPHFGASPPAHTVEPILDVGHHAFVGAVVDDPAASAELFTALLGTHVTFDDPDATLGEPRTGVSLGDCTLALFAMPGANSDALWGWSYDRARTHVLGLSVPDLRAVDDVLEEHGFAVVRRTETMVLLDPATTGGVQIALVDELLSNDPRLG